MWNLSRHVMVEWKAGYGFGSWFVKDAETLEVLDDQFRCKPDAIRWAEVSMGYTVVNVN
jgi:hypothetical protein